MAEIVNLNRFRKGKAKAEAKARADANALKHGQTKAARDLEKARAEKAARDLAAHQREGDDPDAP